MEMKARRVPDPAPLSKWESWVAWFKMNRAPIGAVILGLSTIFRVVLGFQGHTEIADTLKMVADLVMGSGGALMLAGATKSDSFHEEKVHEEVRRRSGAFRPPSLR